MGASVGLVLSLVIGQPTNEPWLAPDPPDLYPPLTAGQAYDGLDGSVCLGKSLEEWTAGFVNAMRGYPLACQRTIDRLRLASQERCEAAGAGQAAADQEKLAEIDDRWPLLDRVLVVGGVAVGAAAIGFVIGALVLR